MAKRSSSIFCLLVSSFVVFSAGFSFGWLKAANKSSSNFEDFSSFFSSGFFWGLLKSVNKPSSAFLGGSEGSKLLNRSWPFILYVIFLLPLLEFILNKSLLFELSFLFSLFMAFNKSFNSVFFKLLLSSLFFSFIFSLVLLNNKSKLFLFSSFLLVLVLTLGDGFPNIAFKSLFKFVFSILVFFVLFSCFDSSTS